MKLNELALIGVAAATIVSCSPAKKSTRLMSCILFARVTWQRWSILLKLQILLCGHPLPMKCV